MAPAKRAAAPVDNNESKKRAKDSKSVKGQAKAAQPVDVELPEGGMG